MELKSQFYKPHRTYVNSYNFELTFEQIRNFLSRLSLPYLSLEQDYFMSF